MDLNIYIGDKVRKNRKFRKLKTEFVANFLGTHKQKLLMMERGKIEFHASQLIKLANIFEISINDFYPNTINHELNFNNYQDYAELNNLMNKANPNDIARANFFIQQFNITCENPVGF